MARKTKAEKLAESRVEKAFYKTCTGVQIPMLELPKIFAAGIAAVAEGASEEELESRIALAAMAVAKLKDFPITLIGDEGHADAQKATVARLLKS